MGMDLAYSRAAAENRLVVKNTPRVAPQRARAPTKDWMASRPDGDVRRVTFGLDSDLIKA